MVAYLDLGKNKDFKLPVAILWTKSEHICTPRTEHQHVHIVCLASIKLQLDG